MTDWSKTPPTVAGWYWWRKDANEPAEIAEVRRGHDGILAVDAGWSLEWFGGEWGQRIPSNEELADRAERMTFEEYQQRYSNSKGTP